MEPSTFEGKFTDVLSHYFLLLPPAPIMKPRPLNKPHPHNKVGLPKDDCLESFFFFRCEITRGETILCK